MLPKEEKQVRGRDVVVTHGGGDRGLPAREKWVHTFGETTACTLRLLKNFKLNEIGIDC